MDNRNRRTPAEVAADASIEHTSKGVFNQVKGNVREAWGRLTGNHRHTLGGKMDQMKGKVQEGLGRLEGEEARIESKWDDKDRI